MRLLQILLHPFAVRCMTLFQLGFQLANRFGKAELLTGFGRVFPMNRITFHRLAIFVTQQVIQGIQVATPVGMLDEDPTDFVIEFFEGFKVVPINFKGPFQDLQHRVLQSRYDGQSIPIVDRGFAIPVDEMAPGFFNDR